LRVSTILVPVATSAEDYCGWARSTLPQGFGPTSADGKSVAQFIERTSGGVESAPLPPFFGTEPPCPHANSTQHAPTKISTAKNPGDQKWNAFNTAPDIFSRYECDEQIEADY
jgi:hypothetical protein